MQARDRHTTADRLSGVLWREREALDLLVSRLEAEYLLLSAGRRCWLAQATRGVEDALDLVMYVDVLRIIETADASAALGLDGNATMALVAAAAEPPGSREFADHYEALHRLTRRAVSLMERAVALDAALGTSAATEDDVVDLVAADAEIAERPRLLPRSLLEFALG